MLIYEPAKLSICLFAKRHPQIFILNACCIAVRHWKTGNNKKEGLWWWTDEISMEFAYFLMTIFMERLVMERLQGSQS